MEIESVEKIVVEVDAVTGNRIERPATDEELANWPSPFAANIPQEETIEE